MGFTTDPVLSPSQEGIAKIQQLYLDKYSIKLTETEAVEVLGRLMRFIYYTIAINESAEAGGAPKEPEIADEQFILQSLARHKAGKSRPKRTRRSAALRLSREPG